MTDTERPDARGKHFSRAYWTAVQGRFFSMANRDVFPAPMFRCEFELDEVPEKAILSASAGGYLEIWLNGRKLGDHVLDLTPAVYDRHVYFMNFDAAPLLRRGKNVCGVILGNSTYNCGTAGPFMLDEIPWRDYPKFLLQLNADGNCVLASGPHWHVWLDGPVRMDAVKNGEFYDADYEIPGWSEPGFDASAWPNAGLTQSPGGELKEHVHPPCRELQILPMRAVGRNVYDCGQNLAGYARIHVKGRKGASVKIRYSEKLNAQGDIDRDAIAWFVRSGEFQTDQYTLKGTDAVEVWNPRFAYHGFRYAEITIAGEAELIQAEAVFTATDFVEYGSFTCSCEDLNRLHRCAVWSWHANFTGFPTDCPTREKTGWTGDANLGCETGLFNFDAVSAYEDWLTVILDTQRPSGQLSCKAPNSAGGYNWGFGPAWDSILLMLPETIRKFTGRSDAIRMCYPAIRRYLDFCDTMMPDGTAKDFGLGDWCSARNYPDTPPDLINTGFVYADFLLASKFADELGYQDDAAFYRKKAEQTRSVFNRVYAEENGGYGSSSPTALATALKFGLAADPVLTARRLRDSVAEQHFHAGFGIFGASFVPRMLAEYGYADEAFEILTQPEYPGWVNVLRQGATTLWEDWEGKSSLNHIMFGDFDAFCYEYFAGFRLNGGHMTISPVFPAKLDSLRAEWNGFTSAWSRSNGKIVLNVEIPAGKEAVLAVGGGTKPLSAGKHRITLAV